MNTSLIEPSPTTLHWLQNEGHDILAKRVREVSSVFLQDDLKERLELSLEASRLGGSKVFRIGNLIRMLTEELTILVLAHRMGVAMPPEVWEAARRVTTMALSLDSLVFDGRNQRPPWKADLWTADIGLNLAFCSHWDSPLELDRAVTKTFLLRECCAPIEADWVDGATRRHSLDSMGHNWWSVIVGGAGLTYALLGEKDKALAIGDLLTQWFHYPGQSAWRKQPNFGVEGDFVEGFGYGEYALWRPLTLAGVLPECEVMPRWLSKEQCRGLVDWYFRAFVRKSDGQWWPRRFGDIHFTYRIHSEIWQMLARLAGDEEFFDLAHELKPAPHGAYEFLLWQPREKRRKSAATSLPSRELRRVYPTSGMAFLGSGDFSLAVRAGEFWNHNHLDAGSYILTEKGVVWADDCGTCEYSSGEYTRYYTSPAAHNVAYAPGLAPVDNPLTQYQGMPVKARFLEHQRTDGIEALEVDTLPLSANGLARSLRWFFVLDDQAAVVWDDLESYTPQIFESLFHTTCTASADKNGVAGARVMLNGGTSTNAELNFYADQDVDFAVSEAEMGALAAADVYNHGDMDGSVKGSSLRWRCVEKKTRQKFGLLIGTNHSDASWNVNAEGWELTLLVGSVRWSVWFNALADGRVMHKNSIGCWRGIETDGYALLQREEKGQSILYSLQSSFVRSEGKVYHASLCRQSLTRHIL